MSSLYKAHEVKEWLQRPERKRISKIQRRRENPPFETGREELGRSTGQKDAHVFGECGGVPLSNREHAGCSGSQMSQSLRVERFSSAKASFSSTQMLMASGQLLHWSVAAFLIGLGIYLGRVCTMSLNETAGSGGSTALLAVYIISTWLGLNLYFAPRQMKLIDRRLYGSGGDKGIVQTSEIMDQDRKGADLPAADNFTAALEAAVQAHEQSAVALKRLLASYSGNFEDSKGEMSMDRSKSTQRLRRDGRS